MRRPAAVALLVAGPVLGACGADPRTGPGTTLDVLAASSLTATFTALAADVEAADPTVDVRLTFAGSSDLVAQVQEGAPADVLATADPATMAGLGAAARAPEPFATNRLTIAVPPGNPGGVTGVTDLADPGLDVVLCAPQVPCGLTAQRLLAVAGVGVDAASEEQSVTDVLGKVAGGEADAGLVYVTDVRSADGAVEEVPVAESARVTTTYVIAVLADAAAPDPAADFVALVTGSEGRRVLDAAGFGPS